MRAGSIARLSPRSPGLHLPRCPVWSTSRFCRFLPTDRVRRNHAITFTSYFASVAASTWRVIQKKRLQLGIPIVSISPAFSSRDGEISAGEQKEALEAIGAEIENLRVAWQFAVENRIVNALQISYGSLFRYYLVRGLYQEGESALGAAAEVLKATAGKDREGSGLLGQLLARQAALNTELSQFERADELLDRSLALLNEHAGEGETAFALSCQGSLCRNWGEYKQARDLMQKSLILYLKNGDRWGAANALGDLGTVAYRLGHYSEARQSAEASLDIHRVE